MIVLGRYLQLVLVLCGIRHVFVVGHSQEHCLDAVLQTLVGIKKPGTLFPLMRYQVSTILRCIGSEYMYIGVVKLTVLTSLVMIKYNAIELLCGTVCSIYMCAIEVL